MDELLNELRDRVRTAQRKPMVLSNSDHPGAQFSGTRIMQESSAQNANRGSNTFSTGRGISQVSGEYQERKEAVKRAKMEKQCTNCNQRGHTVDQCFKIHGYPEWFKELKNKNGQKAQVNVADTEENPFAGVSEISRGSSKFDPEMLAAICQEMYKLMKGKGPLDFTDMAYVLSSSRCDSNSTVSYWIVDTGASDHMTSSA